MSRRIRGLALCLAALFIWMSCPSGVSAEGIAGNRKIVAIFPVINGSNIRGSHYLNEMVHAELLKKFDSSRYLVITGQTLLDFLARYGISDYRWADNASLTAALREMHVDYGVRTEIQEVTGRQKIDFPDIFLLMKTWVVVVPLDVRVTDVRSGTTVYSAVIADQGMYESFIGFTSREQAAKAGMINVLEKLDRETLVPE